jgi:hypothetical protein
MKLKLEGNADPISAAQREREAQIHKPSSSHLYTHRQAQTQNLTCPSVGKREKIQSASK